MSITISPERQAFHEWLARFKQMLPVGSIVGDIGKSRIHDYRETFTDCVYKTIDRDPDVGPDMCMDVENVAPSMVRQIFDAMICNGVTEQCGDPFDLVKGLNALMRPSGLVLFGITSVGFPIYGNDKTRFTPQGAEHLVSTAGFSIICTHEVKRADVPSYIIMICKKLH